MKITSWGGGGNLFFRFNAREVECEIVGLLTDDQYAKYFEAL